MKLSARRSVRGRNPCEAVIAIRLAAPCCMIRKDLIDALRGAHRGRRDLVAEVAAEIGMYALDEPLSPREIEVLREVSSGRANKQIAARLDLSEETIKTHMRNILSKLGAQDRTHAVMIALDRGIITAWDRS